MIVADQQTAIIRDEYTKAALRTESDIKMLQLLRASSVDDSVNGSEAPDIGNSSKVKLKPISRSFSSMQAPGNIDDNIDFKLGNSRNIQNQTMSLSMLPQDTESKRPKKKKQFKKLVAREAELSLAVTNAITRRELEVSRLALDAADLNRTYMSIDESQVGEKESNRHIIIIGLENLFSQMAAVRAATIQVAE